MKIKNLLLLFAIFPLIISCQEKFNGKNEQTFKSSQLKVEKELTPPEKINLEKALRVIAMESMRLKYEEEEKYKEKSFNQISLEMVDGRSYSTVTDFAEDILKKRNKEEIEQLSTEIDSLKIQKSRFMNIQKALNVFKMRSVRIKKEDFFDELVPTLEIEYQYIGKNKLIGPKSIQFDLLKKSTNTLIKSEGVINGDDQSIMENGDIITTTLILSQTKDSNPHLWNAQKYPIENPNLADYDLELKVSVSSLVIAGKKVEILKSNSSKIDAEIKNKQEKMIELKSLKGTLDELELTNQ